MFTIQDVLKLPINREIVGKTLENVIKKFSYTRIHSIKKRMPLELLDNLFQGDLAKNSLLWYLRRQKLCLFDYDEIRADEFKKPDPDWDICTADEKTFLEVKSSLPPAYLKKKQKKFSNKIVDELDIKITASIKNEKMIPPNQLMADIHIQVYYNAEGFSKIEKMISYQTLKDKLEDNPDSLLELIHYQKRLTKPYFFGYCTRHDIEEYLEYLDKRGESKTWEFQNCVYWRYPIQMAKNMNRLIQRLRREDHLA